MLGGCARTGCDQGDTRPDRADRPGQEGGARALHQFAKLSRLGRLALADHLGRWLEDADNLAFAPGVAAEDAGHGLAHDLLNPRHHHVEHLTVTFQSCLLDDRRAALHAVTDLPGEAFGLSHHAAGRLEETAIRRLKPRSEE